MESLRRYLKSFGLLHEQELADALALFERQLLPKGFSFTKEGQPCRQLAFIKSGIFRSYYTTAAGEDMTYCFRFPNDFVGAYSSFITGGPSVEHIESLTPVEVYMIRKDEVEKLVHGSHNWAKLLKVVAEQQYLELEDRVFSFQRLSAAERYQALLTKQPRYVLEIPLQYIASYLGITQRHLSRVRKELHF